ncbi:MAG: hypothetical protein LCH84_14540 [Gemmatimonadetes bacterium]|nr:hypothetical protein [Gemmatimonadota bacterium]
MSSRNQQTARLLQERTTTLAADAVLAEAVRFFATGSGVYSAFPEKRGPAHVVLRGQGGEEVVIGVRAVANGTAVTGSSYLFDQQIAQFLSGLPLAPEPVIEALPAADEPAVLPAPGGAA